jgi:hypothetical protein
MKKHPEAQESSFRNYVSRHSRLLIFVGALIVFVTFLVKEGLRERLKDLVDSIDTAQSVFVAERENQQMSQRLAEIYRISVVSYDNMHNPAPQPGEAYPITIATIMSHYQGAYDAEQRLESELNAVDRLLEKMPTDQNREKKLNDVQTQFKAVQKNDEGFRNTPSPHSTSELKENLNSAVSLEHQAWDTETAIQNLSLSILKDSGEVKKRDETYFKIATWGSYLLYCLGWGLGLIGKLFGFDGFGGDA